MKIDKNWHKEQIKLYKEEHEYFKVYAETLKNILERACAVYAPLAIIQTRAKTLSSFAEKAIRKRFKYDNPVKQFTDLCGARVITHTKSEVEALCKFVETNLVVDKANSQDVSSRLKKNEFGYLSVHYIVTLPDKPVLGIPIPECIGNRKAEIQIRTLLQHAWSDITHDRLYKNPFIVPEKLEREAARLAAVMEKADDSFTQFAKEIDTYRLSYDAYEDKDIYYEIEILKTILENEPAEKNKPAIALRIAKMAKLINNWDTIIDVLEPFALDKNNYNRYEKSEILLELGNSLCKKYKVRPNSPEYKKGQEFLKRAAYPEKLSRSDSLPVTDEEYILRSKALSTLAWTYKNGHGSREKKEAKNLYLEAHQLDPKNPYILADCLENFIDTANYSPNSKSYFPLLKQTMLDAINACRYHINASIEIPHAFFAIGRFNFLLNNFFKSLEAYIEAINFCTQYKKTHNNNIFDDTFLEALDNELEFLENTNYDVLHPSQFNWVYKTLLLGKACLLQDKEILNSLENYPVKPMGFTTPLLIISGDMDNRFQVELKEYEGDLREALKDFEGTIISGGIKSGIPGIVGKVVKELNNTGSSHALLIGYIPETIPVSIKRDENYAEIYCACDSDPEKTFGPGESIQYWFDLLSSGIKPGDVVLIGIGGDQKARIEYKLALALGARVAVIDSSGGTAAEIVNDKTFMDNDNLLNLPRDAMILRAVIMHGKESSLTQEQVENAAKAVHQNYIKNKKSDDPSLKPWHELNADLKWSNIQQVKYCEEILGSQGYGIRPATGNKPSPPDFSEKQLEAMAIMEHGRWVVERLLNGWKYGEQKDIENKISPYLVPWSELPDDIKQYDYDVVKNYSNILAEAGLEIYRK